ncbi:separase [Artemisia annua]|uniref:separase n=1 Tax=Artemisia annua TaxID=35608 RepID=A0A2U1NY99_ARTAN|nr:separase [Artemisia annua]
MLRHQEVYRMPSIARIFYSLNVCCLVEKKVVENPADLGNLLDFYYLVNPNADLIIQIQTTILMDTSKKSVSRQGKLRESPSGNELSEAIANHDLFIYIGHGNYKFGELNRCPTTILMGCASGLLALNGPYLPHGAPLYNLLAGSPIVIAHLWSIRSLETLIFSKALFDAWIKERSCDSECNISSLACEDVTHIGSLIRLGREANNFKYIDGGL